jgi:hypothetical protein
MAKKSKKSEAGRPDEGRVALKLYVRPATARAIIARVVKTDRERNTLGKVVDGLVG